MTTPTEALARAIATQDQLREFIGKHGQEDTATFLLIEADAAISALRLALTQQPAAVVYPPDGTVSPFTVINLGTGRVQMGDSIHDGRLPALWFGKNGQGMGHEEVLNRQAHAGETLAVVTFANVEGLDVLLDVIQRIRRVSFPGAAHDLLDALRAMVAIHDEPSGFAGKYGKALDEAIAKQQDKIDTRLSAARAAIARAIPAVNPNA